MSGLSITCVNCHRSWRLAVDASPYVLLDLASRPCPFCEAGTLNCLDAEEGTSASRRARSGSGSCLKRKEAHDQRQMDR